MKPIKNRNANVRFYHKINVHENEVYIIEYFCDNIQYLNM